MRSLFGALRRHALRHVDHAGNHNHRHPFSQGGQKVKRPVGKGVDQLVCQAKHFALQRFGAPRCESAQHQRAQPGVGGRLALEHGSRFKVVKRFQVRGAFRHAAAVGLRRPTESVKINRGKASLSSGARIIKKARISGPVN
jgi:hypothetical protein